MRRHWQPGQNEFSVYVDGFCRRKFFGKDEADSVRAENAATEMARKAWDKRRQEAEITIVRYNHLSCDTVNHWFPASHYPPAALMRRLIGRMLSYRQGNGASAGSMYAVGQHHLSTEGEERYLRVRFGPTEKVLEYHRDIACWAERRRDEVGQVTIVGRGMDVTAMVIGRTPPVDPMVTPEEVLVHVVHVDRDQLAIAELKLTV